MLLDDLQLEEHEQAGGDLVKDDGERAYIVEALERNHGAVGLTADALGVSRKNLWERMRRLGIGARS